MKKCLAIHFAIDTLYFKLVVLKALEASVPKNEVSDIFVTKIKKPAGL